MIPTTCQAGAHHWKYGMEYTRGGNRDHIRCCSGCGIKQVQREERPDPEAATYYWEDYK